MLNVLSYFIWIFINWWHDIWRIPHRWPMLDNRIVGLTWKQLEKRTSIKVYLKKCFCQISLATFHSKLLYNYRASIVVATNTWHIGGERTLISRIYEKIHQRKIYWKQVRLVINSEKYGNLYSVFTISISNSSTKTPNTQISREQCWKLLHRGMGWVQRQDPSYELLHSLPLGEAQILQC